MSGSEVGTRSSEHHIPPEKLTVKEKGSEGNRPGQLLASPGGSGLGLPPLQGRVSIRQEVGAFVSAIYEASREPFSKRSGALGALTSAPGSLSTLPGLEQSHLGISTSDFPISEQRHFYLCFIFGDYVYSAS